MHLAGQRCPGGHRQVFGADVLRIAIFEMDHLARFQPAPQLDRQNMPAECHHAILARQRVFGIKEAQLPGAFVGC
jgi:hypothetical protein